MIKSKTINDKMFNVYLVWNLDYILKIFKSSLFDIITYNYEFIENHYILTIKYTSKIVGLKLNPVMVKHPRYSTERCMALFFITGDSMNEYNQQNRNNRLLRFC